MTDGPTIEFCLHHEARERLASVLPNGPSQSRPAMLTLPELPASTHGDRSNRYCRADPRSAVVASLQLRPDGPLTAAAARSLIRPYLQERDVGGIIYGRCVDSGAWSSFLGSDAPEGPFDQLEVDSALINLRHDESIWAARLRAHRWRQAIEALCASSSQIVGHCYSMSALATFRRIGQLGALASGRASRIFLVAENEEGLDGRAIFDVFEGIGVEWGDSDAFHWGSEENDGSPLFSVGSLSEAGYFLPEDAAGELRPIGLFFELRIARTPAAPFVYEQMLLAAKHAHDCLGGVLCDRRGKALGPERELRRIARFTERLARVGLQPGADHTLRLF